MDARGKDWNRHPPAFVYGVPGNKVLDGWDTLLIATWKCSSCDLLFVCLLFAHYKEYFRGKNTIKAVFASFSGTLKKLWIKFLVWLKASK
jgi:hypothetical protein